MVIFLRAALIFFLLCCVGGAGPCAHALPSQRFVFQATVAGFHYRLELYSAKPEEAAQLSRDVWQTMRTAAGPLAPAVWVKLLQEARSHPTALTPVQVTFLQTLLRYHRFSQGALDPTAAPLYALWGFTAESFSYHLPTAHEIQTARARLRASALELQELPPRLWVSQAGLQLMNEPGLQGFLVDQAVSVLRKAALPAALTGSQTGYYLGAPPEARAWKVAVPDPIKIGKVFSYLYVRDEALAQISVNDNAFSRGGVNYHALLDARTGWPSEEALALSVTRPSALDAQLTAHLLVRLPDEQCRRLLPELPGLHGLKLLRRNGFLSMLEYSS